MRSTSSSPHIAGVVHRGRGRARRALLWLAENTNAVGFTAAEGGRRRRRCVHRVSRPGSIDADDVAAMQRTRWCSPWPIRSRDRPAEAIRYDTVVANGRSDFPNQINNVRAVPGRLPRPLGRPSQPTITPAIAAGRRPSPRLRSSPTTSSTLYINPSVFHADVHLPCGRPQRC